MKEQLLEYRKAQFVDNEHATLDMIKDHHNKRMAKLEEMIIDRENKVERHEKGIRRLSSEDFDKFSRQVRNFKRKLEQMKGRNEDEHHLEHLEELKSLHSMNRLDYIDYKDNLGNN
mmetsp:Transcript_68200/g.102853  ORF Transcript_68200/g.102853 Transcript_68200/m.102853 type:complete len:116 (-) Transcript_68200:181-528(-)|eukprot:CAMPEP_0117029184 /NCGR_PEP_ID=MMETSP0472-20121206/21155_1 /TAXON_ID=693140 ORGANISM="Tiarina fusus, Strain LIS" /NCGR_SAMPLE_ID=MMETSP0472 /ASSEMBLY_ACC=CAM_ASM_000603 /LENGTH=115 /DNA_ID=CAMNT_0004736881 /DNA_START=151 /DNA_END=498 /DNA_ORIENTATION=-